jgi:pyruvate-formate lyase-activating enzyme
MKPGIVRLNLPITFYTVTSTMLVPGYNETEQVSQIAGFIASLDRRIPYALLAFVPHFHLSDLPCTSSRQAR